MPTWRGRFTYKITELSVREDGTGGDKVPRIYGRFWNTFAGYYRYKSPTVDGQFGLPLGPGTAPLERFRLYLPRPLAFSSTIYNWTDSEIPGPLITVSGGVVTDFELNNEIGPVGLSFDFSSFHISQSEGSGYAYSAIGWIVFENPIRAFVRRTTKSKKIEEAVV
jgi:hypothetical protein